MNLTLKRKIFSKVSTIGGLFIDGRMECFTLEDFNRELYDSMTNAEIVNRKVYGKTCIPFGKYEIAVTYSNHFQRFLPLLMNVKGFDGIRIHPGNTEIDTFGCVLLGDDKHEDQILNSRVAFARVFEKIRAAMRTEKVWIEIVKDEEPQYRK